MPAESIIICICACASIYFNLVMDPLLVLLREISLGLSINGLFLGVFAYADDIRTLASSIDDSVRQVATVHSFMASRGL